MASIHRRDGRWRVQVRRRGLPPISKTFERNEDAKRWAQQMEGRLAADEYVDLSEAKRTTLREALDRYASNTWKFVSGSADLGQRQGSALT